MGGCCCCSSKGVGVNYSPAFYDYQRASEEREPLSAHRDTVTALSTGLLVDTNLETSAPDTYRPPPLPLPYDSNLGLGETNSDTSTFEKEDDDLKKSDCKMQDDNELAFSIDVEAELEKSGELKKSSEVLILAVEECPTCLEEYDDDNPKIITKCDHHFHLACILEWMDRSDTCPVCDQEMVFDC